MLFGERKPIVVFWVVLLGALCGVLAARYPAVVLISGLLILMYVIKSLASYRTFFNVFLVLVSIIGFAKKLLPSMPVGIFVQLTMLGLIAVALFLLRQQFRHTVGSILIMAFISLGLVQVFNPNLPSYTVGLEGFRSAFFPILIYFLVVMRFHKSVSEVPALGYFLVLLGAFCAAFGLFQEIDPTWFISKFNLLTASGSFIYKGKLRAFSTADDPFGFASFMMITLFLSYVYLRKHHFRVREIIFFGLIMLGMVYSLVRGIYVGVLFGLIFIVLMSGLKRNLVVVGLAVLGVLSILHFGSHNLVGRLTSITNAGTQASIIAREQTWGVLNRIIESHPLGIGLGTTGGASYKYASILQYGYLASDSYYYKLMVETGIPGLLLYLATSFYLVLDAIKFIVMNKYSQYRDYVVVSGAIIIAMMVANITNNFLELYPTNYLYWIILGIQESIVRHERDRSLNQN